MKEVLCNVFLAADLYYLELKNHETYKLVKGHKI